MIEHFQTILKTTSFGISVLRFWINGVLISVGVGFYNALGWNCERDYELHV